MSNTKKQLIELGIESLCGGNPTPALLSKYHPAVVSKFLGMAYADLLQNLFDNGKKDYMVFDTYTKPFPAIVEYDAERDERFIRLPAPMIPLTPKQAGIRSLSMYKGQKIGFAFIQSTALPIWEESEAMAIDGTVACYLEGEKIFFRNPNAPEVGAKLMVKMVCDFESFEDTDIISVPGGKNEVLFDSMYQFMNRRGNKKQDTNDNVTVQAQQ